MASDLRPRRARSRHGCLCCRRRRKKCDEQKPRCIACQRNKLLCTWPDEPENIEAEPCRAVDAREDPIPPFLEVFRAACAQPRPRLHPELSIQISENLHHYLDHTAQTFEALTPLAHQPLWRGFVLEDAKAFPFVMNALNAITALHRAHRFPETASRHIENAYSSRAASIGEFRAAVSDVTPQNASGTLSFAAIQVLVCLAFPIAEENRTSSNILDGAYELLVAIRGFFHLQPVVGPRITNPIIRAWVQNPLPKSSETPQNPPFLRHLSYLYDILQKVALVNDERHACHAALTQLWKFLSEVSLEPLEWIKLFTWPIFLPEEFLLLIRQRRPFALVILAYWFAFVFGESGHWLLYSWSGSILAGVKGAVGSEWWFAFSRLEFGAMSGSRTSYVN